MAASNQHQDPRRTGAAKLVDIYSSVPTMARGKPVLIGGDPKGNNIVYCCGNSVVVRNVREPRIADTYSEHAKAPTVARYAPSGFYIASGDEMGNVRIWDTTQPGKNPLKLEIRALAGRIYDLAWTDDSKRIVAVGDGRETYGNAFFADSGASVGEISGHSKTITSVDIKQTRPYRVMTGSEDNANCWYEGPPFKWKRTIHDHTRFVNCVRFSPSGDHVISVAQDKSGLIFDGKTGDSVGALEEAHTGGIYCASWSKDGKSILTASADFTSRIFDAETRKCVQTFQFSDALENQQLGCLWQNDDLLSIGLNGYLNYLDRNSGKVARTAYGHMNFVNSLAYDSADDHFYSVSFDSVSVRWNRSDCATSLFAGASHSNMVSQLSVAGNKIYSAGMDDSFGVSETGAGKSGHRLTTGSPARGISAAGNTAVGVHMKGITLIQDGKDVAKLEVTWSPLCVAISPDAKLAAVGGEDKLVRIYTINGNSLTETKVLDKHSREVSAIVFSPDGKFLASADKNRSIILWKTDSWAPEVNGQWCFHGSTINSLAFSPDSQILASGSLDQDIYLWCPAKKMKRHRIDLAHRGGVNVVTWVDNATLASAGQDCVLKTWSIERTPFQ